MFGLAILFPIILRMVISGSSPAADSLVWNTGLIVILGVVTYGFWKVGQGSRPAYLGISLAMAGVSESITTIISEYTPLPSFLHFLDLLGGFSDVAYYALETLLVLGLLLKWATQEDWKTTLIRAFCIVGVSILAMILFFIVLLQFYPLQLA